MINTKRNSLNFKEYTDDLMDKVKTDLGATDLEFYSNKEKTRKSSIVIKNKVYLIQFTFLITPGTLQLKIDISMEQKDAADLDLHDLKIKLKNMAIQDWEQCVWQEDRQSEAFAEELYKDVHSVENTIRRLINNVLFYNLSGDWWDKYMPIDLKKKYNQRNDPYRRRAPSFENIHTNLMSIDTGDLVSILGFKTYKVKDNNIFHDQSSDLELLGLSSLLNRDKETLRKFQHIMDNLIYDPKSIEHIQTQLSEVLREQMEVDKDFWEDYFAEWFSCNFRAFQGRWNEFNTDRNHVAHNKLIDKELYKKFKTSMSQLLTLITEAEDKFSKHLDLEETQYLDELEQIEDDELLDHYKDLIEEESGVRIRDADDIIEMFQEYITYAFEGIKEELYYRTDLEITYYEPVLTEDSDVFQVRHLAGNTLRVDVKPFLDDSEGATSHVLLVVFYNEKFLEEFKISYINGEAVYNEEQTNYMPGTEDELYVSSLDKLRICLENKIEEEMPEISEDELAEYSCKDCCEYTIYLPTEEYEDKYERGKCLRCGHLNPIGICVRCEMILNQPEDGLCESCDKYIRTQ